MSSKKLIAVIGLTGNQGSSVATNLLKSGKWNIRGLTRDAKKPKAQEWSSKGAELVEGDVTDQNSLKKLFNGAYGAFVVTNYWEQSQMGKETQIGSKMAEIAKESGVEHFVWSTLPNYEKMTNGKHYVQHFTDKAKVDDKVKELNFKYSTFVQAGVYFSNFFQMGLIKKLDDGSAIVSLPFPGDKPYTGCDIDDIGLPVAESFDNPDKYNGKYIPIYSTNMTLNEYCAEYEEVTGIKTKYVQATPGIFGKEMQDMLDVYAEYGVFGKEFDPKNYPTKSHESFTTWKQFVKKNTSK